MGFLSKLPVFAAWLLITGLFGCDSTSSTSSQAQDAGDVDGSFDASSDFDGSSDDAGPDEECVALPGIDLPDSDREDSDCDGFDGSLVHAVLVSETPVPITGAISASTLSEAVEAASLRGRSQVWVPAGEHSGEVLEVRNGVGVYGGYLPSEGWRRSPTTYTVLQGEGPLLLAQSIDSPTVIDRIRFVAVDSAVPGGSSVAAQVVDSTGVLLQNVRLESGRGGDGANGEQPPAGQNGVDGADGDDAVLNSVATTPSCSSTLADQSSVSFDPAFGGSSCDVCGLGGFGGTEGWPTGSVEGNDPAPGEGGSESGSCISNGGSAGSNSPVIGFSPQAGGHGAPGVNGAVGEIAPFFGTFSEAGYVASVGAPGGAGGTGSGGGGGGSSLSLSCGGCTFRPPEGGGGGSGGCGGPGGEGGQSGGASVGLWIWSSEVTLSGVTIVTSEGGTGGDGSVGGSGGAGGRGGDPGSHSMGLAFCSDGMGGFSALDASAQGGSGGMGGSGGGGGGGSGGPSIGVFLGGAGSSVTDDSLEIIRPALGASAGQSGDGSQGHVGRVLDIFEDT
ncbi:MAG: hypothetical protein AAF550_14500 [Myxococcota bacterium]